MIAFINASPLIYLGKLGLLRFLPSLFDTLITCPEVHQEVMEDIKAQEHAALEIAFRDWIVVQEPKKSRLLESLKELEIHAGEAGVIVLASESTGQNVVFIDDRDARSVARTMGINITGTLGILLALIIEGKISKADVKRNLRNLLQNTDFYISTALYSRVLEEIDKLN